MKMFLSLLCSCKNTMLSCDSCLSLSLNRLCHTSASQQFFWHGILIVYVETIVKLHLLARAAQSSPVPPEPPRAHQGCPELPRVPESNSLPESPRAPPAATHHIDEHRFVLQQWGFGADMFRPLAGPFSWPLVHASQRTMGMVTDMRFPIQQWQHDL